MILRFLLQLVRADFYNPISQFLVTVTNPPLIRFRRIIPGYAGIDVAAIVLILCLEILKTLCLYFLVYHLNPQWLGLIVLAIAEFIYATFNIFFYAIIMQAILSWINPGNYSPVSVILYDLTEPLLRPARRMLPPISGLDLSPMLVLIAMQLVSMLILTPMLQYARFLSIGIGIFR